METGNIFDSFNTCFAVVAIMNTYWYSSIKDSIDVEVPEEKYIDNIRLHKSVSNSLCKSSLPSMLVTSSIFGTFLPVYIGFVKIGFDLYLSCRGVYDPVSTAFCLLYVILFFYMIYNFYVFKKILGKHIDFLKLRRAERMV